MKDSRSATTSIGEFRIDGQGLTFAFVDGYQGDINLQYLCFLCHSALLFHNGKTKRYSFSFNKMFCFSINKGNGTMVKTNMSLSEVISRSLPELITRLPADAFPKYNNNGMMVRGAYEIRSAGDRTDGKQKIIRGSLTIEGAMLHQRIVPKNESWLLQVKFFT